MTTALTQISDHLDASMLAGLRDIAAAHTYPPGTILTHQGQTEHTFYVIEEGQAVVLRRMEDGSEQVLNTLGPRQSFGEMALLDDNPRLATIRALTEISVLEITADSFKTLLGHDPELAVHITRRVLANLRTLDQLAIQDLRAKNALLQKAYLELQAAQAELVEKERLERELELAAEMQRSLLPSKLPRYDDYHFAAYLTQARHVGGDLFGVQPLDEEHVAVLIADVADKGMYAALLMAVTRTLFMQEAQRSLSPAEVALAVHRGLMTVGGGDGEEGMDAFVTAFYGVLHRPSGRLTYVRAAQDHPLLLRPGQPPTELPGGGRFLGMLPNLSLQEEVATLQPGDYLLLYSDGVTDAHNEQRERYGLPRLKITFQDTQGAGAGPRLAELAMALNQWRGAAPAFDDLTMLLVEAVAARE